MRGRLKDLFDRLGFYSNTQLGATVITAVGTYVLTRGAREAEVASLKRQLENAQQENGNLGHLLRTNSEKVSDLLRENQNNLAEVGELKTENRFVRYAFANSLCLFRQQYPEGSTASNSTTAVSTPSPTELKRS